MKELLKKLCYSQGVSGNETDVADLCCEILAEYGEASKDFNNNVVAILGNINSDKTLLLDAHIDQIGFVVTEINHNGFIRVEKCGGIDLRTVLDSPVIVQGKKILRGIFCCMPPHLTDNKENEAVSADNLWIDLGLSYEEVKENISLGDNAYLQGKFTTLLNDRVSCSALDNRAGIATILRVCQLIKDKDIEYKVVVLFSCQEETYATGAITKAFEFDPDEAISVDVSFANQQGIDDQYSKVQLGKGPMICYSSTLNKDMSNAFVKIAKEYNIPYQYEVCGGRTGTNADHIGVTKSGVKTAVISIPQKNMHTQVEIVDINDIENTAELITKYILNGGVK